MIRRNDGNNFWFVVLGMVFCTGLSGIRAGEAAVIRPRLALGNTIPCPGGGGTAGPLFAESEQGPHEGLPEGRPWVAVRLEGGEAGSSGFETLFPLLEGLGRGGQPVVLRLKPAGPLAPGGEPGGEAFLRGIAQVARGRVTWYAVEGLLEAEGQAMDFSRAAFAIKAAAVTLRGEDPEAGIALVLPLESGPALLENLLVKNPELEAYIDGILLTALPTTGFAKEIRPARERLVPRVPGATWMVDVPLPPEVTGTALSEEAVTRVLEALSGGADLALLDLPSSHRPGPFGRDFPLAADALLRLARFLSPALGFLPTAGAGIETEGEVAWLGLFNESSFEEWFLFWASTRPGEAGAKTALLVDPNMRRNFRLRDPLTGEEGPARVTPAPENRVRVDVPLIRRPLLLMISRARASEGFETDPGTQEVRGVRTPTADEIIAMHQAWKAYQDDRLDHYRRDAEISFRLRVSQASGTFDLTLRAGEFWEKATGAEWVIHETFFNGAKLGWDKVPELPFVSREKVVAVPLDLNLDRRYAYELESQEMVGERRAWQLRFTPLTESVSLYRGRAWIDQTTGALLKVTTIETKLTPPLIASEETQVFGPHEGPGGTAFWLPTRLDGQQIYTVSGANLVVLRQIVFGIPMINDPGFTEARAQAYASPRQMLRDTPEGYKWLARTPEGGRVVQPKGDTRQTFLLAGVLHDSGTGGVIPLAGLNYTDIDFLGRGMLFNVFFAGALANVTLTDPGIAGTKLDLGLTINAVGFSSRERQYNLGEEIDRESVRRISQAVRLTAGYPLGRYFKLRAVFDATYNNYQKDDDTRDFTLPADHWLRAANLQLSFDRGGWGMAVEATRAVRSAWKPWGPDDHLSTHRETEAARTFSTWEAAARKSWFLPKFQKVELRARYQEGKDFDRFSSFRFGFLGGERVRGFGGSGIRYDRGVLASAEYSFDLAEILRFDLTLDHAQVRDAQLRTGYSGHTGVGLAANFVGPWRTLWRLDTGYAWKSDLKAAEGGTEILLSFLRLF